MKRLGFLLLIMMLSGCTGMRYGNFTETSQGKDMYLAKDAALQLSKIYPPAKNTFHISQKIHDGFGSYLTHELRMKGYGVMENALLKQANFFYVVDKIGHFYRVSLYVHSHTLSRVYKRNGEKFLPVNAWSYRE
jgi:hypothetical protein